MDIGRETPVKNIKLYYREAVTPEGQKSGFVKNAAYWYTFSLNTININDTAVRGVKNA
jgi:hypothetical protein